MQTFTVKAADNGVIVTYSEHGRHHAKVFQYVEDFEGWIRNHTAYHTTSKMKSKARTKSGGYE